MTIEELKALIEGATAKFEAQKAENDKLATKASTLEAELNEIKAKVSTGVDDAGVKAAMSQTVEDLQNEISDLRGKMKSPAMAIDTKAQKDALRQVAANAYHDFIGKAKATNMLDFKSFSATIVDKVKALSLGDGAGGDGTAAAAVASVLSMDLIEYAREYSPILSLIGQRQGLTRDFSELVLVARPSIADGLENVAGTDFPATSTQEYSEVKTDVIKVMANAPITDEAMNGSTYNVYADLVRLLGEQLRVTLAYKVLFGNGADKNGRGMLSTGRIDLTDATGESWKASMDRDPDVFPAISTGVSGSLGADDAAIIAFMIDVHNTLPTAYLNGASYVMNRKTKGTLEKVKHEDGTPAFKFNFIEGDTIRLNGYPVILDDTYPDIAANSTPITFGDHGRAFAMSNGDIDYMQLNPYKKQGVTYVEHNKEIFTIMQASDAILAVACTTNGPA